MRKKTISASSFHTTAKRVFMALLCGIFLTVMVTDFSRAGNNSGGGIDTGAPDIPSQPMMLAKAQGVYYENTIKDIILADCGRCHSGPTRNLMDYDNLKAYADSGLLATMVQGPMARFTGNDQQTILDWISAGAPEKPGATPAGFFSWHPGAGQGGAGCMTGQPFVPDVPSDKITYGNTVQYILAKDCLRCHSGPFRNLTTYKNVKMYVDNGLLESLVGPGGPMHRFAGPDARLIITWVHNGAPQ